MSRKARGRRHWGQLPHQAPRQAKRRRPVRRAVRDDGTHRRTSSDRGGQVLITHGNGPQVGFIMLRSEIARAVAGMHIVPLVSCVADTQGAIGCQIQQSLDNVLKRRGLTDKTGRTVSLVTQVRDIADPGFSDPDKFVGEFYAEGSARGAAPTASRLDTQAGRQPRLAARGPFAQALRNH